LPFRTITIIELEFLVKLFALSTYNYNSS